MTIPSFLLTETYKVYRYKSTATPNEIGEMPAPNPSDTTNVYEVGEISGRVNTGDSLEPDIYGSTKTIGVDTTSMWIGFFEVDANIELQNGDLLVSQDDTSRRFQIQFIDKDPGGGDSEHHYECRLQTSEVFRNEA